MPFEPLGINERESYCIFGTAVTGNAEQGYSLTNALRVPVPTTLPFTDEFLADARRNAVGAMIAQQIGRTQYKAEIGWEWIANRKWWEINRWFRTHGYFFYMFYFSHSDGIAKIHRFYRGNAKQATPGTEQETIDGVRVPRVYYDAGFSVIDMGEEECYTVRELRLN